jgi:hypothetical protein
MEKEKFTIAGCVGCGAPMERWFMLGEQGAAWCGKEECMDKCRNTILLFLHQTTLVPPAQEEKGVKGTKEGRHLPDT